MSLSELLTLLDELKIDVAYGKFTKKPKLPFISIMETSPDIYKADDTHYNTDKHFAINYYFEKKEPLKEEIFESLLLSNGITFEVSEDIYIEDETMYMKIYDI